MGIRLSPTEALTFDLAGAEITLPVAEITRLWKGRLSDGDAHVEKTVLSKPPRIGSSTRSDTGIYAGVARATDDTGDYVLEVIDEKAENLTWSDALKWAEKVGGRLPTRKEAALMFANVAELFERDYYWTCEQFESDPSYAWCQSVDFGHQSTCHESSQLRARAVRRLPLSVI